MHIIAQLRKLFIVASIPTVEVDAHEVIIVVGMLDVGFDKNKLSHFQTPFRGRGRSLPPTHI
jgi:hypothetical protein